MKRLVIFYQYYFKNHKYMGVDTYNTDLPKHEALKKYANHFYKTNHGYILLEGKRHTRAYFLDELLSKPIISDCVKGDLAFVYYSVIGRDYAKAFVTPVMVQHSNNKYYMKQQAKEVFLEEYHAKYNNTRLDNNIRVYLLDTILYHNK